MKQPQKGKKNRQKNAPKPADVILQQEAQNLVRLTGIAMMAVLSLLFLLLLYYFFA